MTVASAGRALVTGASGMLAHDLVPALRRASWIVTALDRTDLDITDPARCIAAVQGHDLVVNTAAYTAVDAAESDERSAFAVNAVGAANVARAASLAQARLIHISTDYVFDGKATEPYEVDHPIAPQSAYGRTKAAGEWAVQTLCADAWVIRTAWLYGAGGPNFVSTMRRIANELDTVAVVADQYGQPTWSRDLADLIVNLTASNARPGVYHGTSTGSTTWYGFAQEVFRLSGLDPERVVSTNSHDYSRPAPRPAWSVLSHASLEQIHAAPLPHWKDRLSVYLREQEQM